MLKSLALGTVVAVLAAHSGVRYAVAHAETVFAPTDEAFAKLPAGTLESLLAPENKQSCAGSSPITWCRARSWPQT
jgi:uncharacterized surface protein with fasciclin (FAS1) repeats